MGRVGSGLRWVELRATGWSGGGEGLGASFQDRCEYIPVRSVGNIPVADGPENSPQPLAFASSDSLRSGYKCGIVSTDCRLLRYGTSIS